MNIDEILLITPGDPEADPVVPDVTHATLSIHEATQTDPYIIKGATGLDADDIFQINAGYFQNFFDGGSITDFYESMLKERIVTLLIKPNPDYTSNQRVGDLRDSLYRAISYSRTKELELRFRGDVPVEDYPGTFEIGNIASLFGKITKLENNLFTDESEVQITFDCSDPFLRSNTYVNLFNPYINPAEPIWSDNVSTSPHGYQIDFQFINSEDHFGLYPTNGGTFIIDYDFESFDTLFISSEYNNRYVYVIRFVDDDPVTIYLNDKIRPGSVWPIMLPGETHVRLKGPFEYDVDYFVAVTTEIRYKTAYWGV